MLLGLMCRPVKLQGWNTNEAIRGMDMFELRRGNPSYRGLKLFFASMLPISIFKLLQAFYLQ